MCDLKDVLDGLTDTQFVDILERSNYLDTNQLINRLHKDNTRTDKSTYILNLNIQSLLSKYNDFNSFLDLIEIETSFKFPIITLQETWLDSYSENLVKLPGYKSVFKHKLPSKIGGGLAIFVLNNLNYKRRDDIVFPCEKQHLYDCLFIEIKLQNNHKIILGTIYRSPGKNSSVALIEDLLKLLTKLNKENCSLIITGDININLLNCDKHLPTSTFLDSCISNGLLPHITLPTRVTHSTATLIDNIFIKSSQPNICLSSGVIKTLISDHYPCFVNIKCCLKTPQNPKYYTFRPITNHNLNKFISDLNKENWSNIVNNHDSNTESKLQNFIYVYNKLYEKHFPIKHVRFKKYKHKNNPWITKGILNSIKTKDRIYCKYLKEKDLLKKQIIYDSLVTHKQILTKVLKQAKLNYWKSTFEDSKLNLKQTWNNINKLIGKGQNKGSLTKDFRLCSDNPSNKAYLANKFNNHFVNAGTKLSQTIPNSCNKSSHYLNKTQRCLDSIYLNPTNETEILNIVRCLKNKPNVGCDNISQKLIKTTIWSILEPLTSIMNSSLESGCFPETFKTAKVIPIHKKGEKDKLDNYRPISILPSLSKILERLISKRLLSFLNKHSFFYNSQYGFRKHMSTELALLELHNILLKNINNNDITCGLFIDLKKAFDTIDHKILLHKLEFNGIRGLALNWFKNYLHNRKQFVQIDSIKSSTETIAYGVPQGSILGPLLFSIYINDLPMTLDKGRVILFADDTSIIYNDKSINNLHKTVSDQSKILVDWLEANKLSLSTNKTKMMLFHKKAIPLKDNFKIKIYDIEIDNVSTLNFLGFILDDKLSWKQHAIKISHNILKINYILKTIKNFVPSITLNTIYHSLIEPHLHYGILSWFNSQNNNVTRLQLLQKRSIRIITRSKYNSHTDPLFKKLHILKINDIYNIKLSVFYWNEINGLTPKNLNNFLLKNNNIHMYNTRYHELIHPQVIKTNLDKQSINHQLSTLERYSSQGLLEYIKQHSLKSSKRYIKTYLISQYKTICTTKNCYVCQQTE